MHKPPKITAIVLTWNSEDYIGRCLDSLLRSTYPVSVLVVDNDSADSTRELVTDRYPGVTLINTGDNLGYAGGNNVGIRHAMKSGADYVFLLNPDAYIAPNCMQELYARLASENNLGGASPVIYFHNSNKIWFAGSTIDWRTGVTIQAGGEDTNQHDHVQYTDRLNGCAMMLPVSIINQVGLMDEKYFLYYEETDWSVILARHGLRLALAPKAKAWHENSSSTGGHLSPLYQYYMTRNKLYFMQKFKPSSLPTVILLLFLTSAENIYVAFRDVNLYRAYVITKAVAKAFFDFIFRRMGKQTIPR